MFDSGIGGRTIRSQSKIVEILISHLPILIIHVNRIKWSEFITIEIRFNQNLKKNSTTMRCLHSTNSMLVRVYANKGLLLWILSKYSELQP